MNINDLRTATQAILAVSTSPQRHTREELHQLAASSFRFGATVVDAPLRFCTWSPAGEGRSAIKHYRTETLTWLKSLPIKELPAPDSAMFMWTLRWAEDWASELVAAWGFKHVSRAFTWVKTNRCSPGWHTGQGYGTRANPEICWLCTRGKPRRLARNVPELLIAPVSRHSEKPEEAYVRVERLFTGPYLDLFARRQRPDWVCWGDELPPL